MDAQEYAARIVATLFDQPEPADLAAWQEAGLRNGYTDAERRLWAECTVKWLEHVIENWSVLDAKFQALTIDQHQGQCIDGQWYWPHKSEIHPINLKMEGVTDGQRSMIMRDRLAAYVEFMRSDPLQADEHNATFELLQHVIDDANLSGSFYWMSVYGYFVMVWHPVNVFSRKTNAELGPRPDW